MKDKHTNPEPDESGIPEVQGVLGFMPEENRWVWIVSECAYCGGLHIHDGGPSKGNPVDTLVVRLAPCATAEPARYRIVNPRATKVMGWFEKQVASLN